MATHVQTDPNAEYTVRKTGQPGTKEYRVYLAVGTNLLSAWHDVPLYHDKKKGIVNMVVEIPRWSNIKMEIARDEFLTPIRQDTKKDTLRYVPNIFPHKGYPWNYGSLPQTYEDPNLADSQTHIPGDDDPLDVCELAGDVGFTGQVKRVKALGAFAVIDEGETDWKVVVIDVNNPLADELREIADIERHMPGYLETMKEWFRVYKVPEGKKRNKVALEGEVKCQKFAYSLIDQCHNSWNKIVTEPTIHTKATMSDVGIENNDLKNQIRQELPQENLDMIDRVAVEKMHFLAPDWPLAASCPGKTLDV